MMVRHSVHPTALTSMKRSAARVREAVSKDEVVTMLETIARALAGHMTFQEWEEMAEDRAQLKEWFRTGRVQDINLTTRDDLYEAARDVLRAMYEPTPEMVEAGRWPAEDDGPLACWQAMLSAAESGERLGVMHHKQIATDAPSEMNASPQPKEG